MDDIELQNNIQSTTNYGLVVKYYGTVEAKASSVKNPYIDEINSLNAFLGEKQIIDEDEEPKGPSFGERLSEKMSNIGNSIASRNYMIYYTSFGAGNFLIDWLDYEYTPCCVSRTEEAKASSIEIYIQITPDSKYSLKIGQGSASYNYSNIDEYGPDSTEKYSYDYKLIGMSLGDFNRHEGAYIDLDYIMPSNTEGESTSTTYSYSSSETTTTTKVEDISSFVNLSVNVYKVFVDKLTLSTGIHYSNEKAFKGNWITIKAGLKF